MAIQFVIYRPNSDRTKPNILDRYHDFLSWKNEGRIEGWSARRTFQPGDLAIFYMASPLRSIVSLGLVDSEPYYEEIDNPADFKNPVFCDFRPVWFLNTPVSIKEAVEQQNLGSWWQTRPYQSIRRIEPSVAQALIQEVLNKNPYLAQTLENLDWDASQPLDFSKVPPIEQLKPELTAGEMKDIPAITEAKTSQWVVEDLLKLSWQQFERLVSELFKQKNKRSKVKLTSHGSDQGVDIVITSGLRSNKEIVQCKRYRSGVKVTGPDMQKFAGAMLKFKAQKGYFVTSSTFNRYAIDFAQGMDVELIDGQNLLRLISQIENFPSPESFIKKYPLR